ncbi:MAG: hypothetical protein QXN87_04950 [Candidatus Bathyarchaeia archaeon]
MANNSFGIKASEEEIINEAIEIVDKAQERNLVLRILGALGIYMCCSSVSKDYVCTYKGLKRLGVDAMFTDIDFAAYSKQRKEIERLMEGYLKFIPDMAINALFGNRRLIFYNTRKNYSVDIFFDKIEFCHDVAFGNRPGKGRLELCNYHIPPEDLLLEKLQIHDMNYKDITDMVMLFLSHRISDVTQFGAINGVYIAKILSDDWGFWYDSMNNLKLVEKYVNKFLEEKKLTKEHANIALENLKNLVNLIDLAPKTRRWNERAKVGIKKMWYRPVAPLEKREFQFAAKSNFKIY